MKSGGKKMKYKEFEKGNMKTTNREKEKKITITDKDSTGQDEWWCTWFRCRNCKENWLYVKFKYCPNCGKELVWKLK